MITIAHPKNDIEHDVIKRLLDYFDNIIYWCMCDHEKDNIYHTHILIYFGIPVQFDKNLDEGKYTIEFNDEIIEFER